MKNGLLQIVTFIGLGFPNINVTMNTLFSRIIGPRIVQKSSRSQHSVSEEHFVIVWSYSRASITRLTSRKYSTSWSRSRFFSSDALIRARSSTGSNGLWR